MFCKRTFIPREQNKTRISIKSKNWTKNYWKVTFPTLRLCRLRYASSDASSFCCLAFLWSMPICLISTRSIPSRGLGVRKTRRRCAPPNIRVDSATHVGRTTHSIHALIAHVDEPSRRIPLVGRSVVLAERVSSWRRSCRSGIKKVSKNKKKRQVKRIRCTRVQAVWVRV